MTVPRILIAKPGLDGHDRGVYLIARVLRDAGMEVIYGGLRQTPAAIAATAQAEDVDVVGLSILSGGHLGLVQKTLDCMAERELADMAVVVGGVIPSSDIEPLLAMGVAAVYPSSTPLSVIVEGVRELVASRG